MGTVQDKKLYNYCDALSTELIGMKERIGTLQADGRNTYGADSAVFKTHERHLVELADIIEWKLQILMKACPYEWEGMDKDVENVVSVGPTGKISDTDISGGFAGG